VNTDEFERQLAGMRPKLHRYCARMTGSAVDGEDVVQEVLITAVGARSGGARIDNFEGWFFRVAHNASLDFLRARARTNVVQLTDDMQTARRDDPQPDVAAVSFRTFLELPVLQRCAVVLKDVLGHTIEEIAEIANCSAPAAKSALQRGRNRLRELVARGADGVRLPLLADDERQRLAAYVDFFRAGDFDSIRGMLADEVRLNLVNRLQLEGRDRVSPYFTRYAEAKHWRYAFGAVDGRPAMLVYDSNAQSDQPAHFVVLDWKAGAISGIQDFLFAPYAMEGADWVRLD
jgi:RNA polymerase sigma-70 factor (ECF subfamily)